MVRMVLTCRLILFILYKETLIVALYEVVALQFQGLTNETVVFLEVRRN